MSNGTIAKGKNGSKSRRRRGDESSDEGEENDEPLVDTSKLDFAQRRELKRQEAATKRRAKQRCYLCGKTGHTRRECKGFEDDGRGLSKFTKAKGDAGAVHLKNSARGKKDHKKESAGVLKLPHGFEPHIEKETRPVASRSLEPQMMEVL